MSIKQLQKQPWDFGTLYSTSYLDSDGFKCRGRLFVFDEQRGLVDREFGGLEGAIKFAEEYSPSMFELHAVAKTPTGFVSAYGTTEEEEKCFNAGNCFMVKGHPYQSLVTLHRIEQAMPKSDNYELIPLRKYFGTNDTIVTELLWHPTCQNLNYTNCPRLFEFMDPAEKIPKFKKDGSITWYETPHSILLKEARKSEDGRRKLKEFISQHEDGGDNWFQEYAQRFIWDERRKDLLPQEIRDIKVEEFLPFAKEALDTLYKDLEAVGRKLRISHHIDARLVNTFFRGIRNGKLQFTLIDQYHCGLNETLHHERKFGGGLTLRL